MHFMRRTLHLVAVPLITGLVGFGGLAASHAGASDIGGAQPDLHYTFAETGLWGGVGIYESGAFVQNLAAYVPELERTRMDVRIKNDGPHPAAFSVQGTASENGFTATYKRDGQGITQAVTNGTYNTGVLAPGTWITIRLVVDVTCGAQKQEPFQVKAKGSTLLAKSDAVALVVTDITPDACDAPKG